MSIEKKAIKLSKKLTQVDKNLEKIIKEIAVTKETSSSFWIKINVAIRREYEKARKISATWTNSNIPETYAESLNEALQKIKAKKIEGVRKINYIDFISSDPSKQSMASLLAETNSTFATGFSSGQKTLIRLSRLTQQLNVSEKQLEKNIAEGFIEKGTIRGATKKIQESLLKKSLDGKIITVIDKNGVAEQWNIKKYSELVARTKLQETTTQAVVNSAQAVGGDLVQVSTHNTLTAYDAQFEGKIFSLSGSDPDFPPAIDLPPFHPNCLHTITVTFKQALKRDGTLKKYEEFSKGNTSVHPFKKNFVPLSERNLTPMSKAQKKILKVS